MPHVVQLEDGMRQSLLLTRRQDKSFSRGSASALDVKFVRVLDLPCPHATRVDKCYIGFFDADLKATIHCVDRDGEEAPSRIQTNSEISEPVRGQVNSTCSLMH